MNRDRSGCMNTDGVYLHIFCYTQSQVESCLRDLITEIASASERQGLHLSGRLLPADLDVV